VVLLLLVLLRRRRRASGRQKHAKLRRDRWILRQNV